MPAPARSRAACMPPMPPPTTRAAPTGRDCNCSEGISNALLGRSVLRRPLLDGVEIQSQRPIDHVRPPPERHLDNQHGSRHDDVHCIQEMTAELETSYPADMCRQPGEYG